MTAEAQHAEDAEDLFREYIDNLYFKGYARQMKQEHAERYQFEFHSFLKSHTFNFSQLWTTHF